VDAFLALCGHPQHQTQAPSELVAAFNRLIEMGIVLHLAAVGDPAGEVVVVVVVAAAAAAAQQVRWGWRGRQLPSGAAGGGGEGARVAWVPLHGWHRLIGNKD
jgi:hypothetical protein